jgi:hypothetical protein
MATSAWFRRPAAVGRSLDSARPPDDLAALLRGAAAQGRQSSRVDGSAYIVRLDGTVVGRSVDLVARILRGDGTPGRPKTPLRITGEINERPGGSTLDVAIAPDDRLTLRWVVGVPLAAILVMVAGHLPIVAVALIGGLAVPNFLLAIRAGQRFALRSVSQVEALLETIVRGG